MPEWKQRGNYRSVLEAITGLSGATPEELIRPARVDPSQIENLPEAAQLIGDCLEKQMPVVILGDYDADGVTSTAILTKLFRHLGAKPRTIIPRRFTDGYGISETLIQGIQGSLLITVDNGITGLEPIARAKEAGNVVIIIDHHLPPAQLPPADVIVDPHVHPEHNGYEHYCGAGLAYKLAEFLCAGETSSEKKGLFFDLLVLACIGTLADVVPLTGDNRYLVLSGLQVINRERWYRQLSSGIQALLGLSPRPYNEDTIKFQTAPILNATGRLYNAGSASTLKALLSEDPREAQGFAWKMQGINETRKQLADQWLAAAQLAAQESPDQPILVLRCPGMPEGIVGIVAGKLSEKTRRPTFLFSEIASSPGLLRGSGRTYGNFDLTPLLQAAAPHVQRLGGHMGAAGITVAEDQYPAMALAMVEYTQAHPIPAPDDTLYYDLTVTEADLPQALAVLKAHAPYGPEVEKPVLALLGYRPTPKGAISYRFMGKRNEHLKLFGQVADAVGFGLSQEYAALGSPAAVDLLGTIEENTFRGRTTLQFQFTAIRASLL
ncbi:MAG: DHH family phosphoesterase [Clostridiales bacterium]|nr:DHH family phosphoesterase [Clostridiales bacterium]MDY4171627.1 DHH family phosphoesterase [Evtepia sp.]